MSIPMRILTALSWLKTAADCDDCVKVLEMAEARVLQRKQELVALDLGQAPVQCPNVSWRGPHATMSLDLPHAQRMRSEADGLR